MHTNIILINKTKLKQHFRPCSLSWHEQAPYHKITTNHAGAQSALRTSHDFVFALSPVNLNPCHDIDPVSVARPTLAVENPATADPILNTNASFHRRKVNHGLGPKILRRIGTEWRG